MKTLKLIAAVCAVALASLGVSTAVAGTPRLGYMPTSYDQLGAKYTCALDEYNQTVVKINVQLLITASPNNWTLKYVSPAGNTTTIFANGSVAAGTGQSWSNFAIDDPFHVTSVADGGYVRFQDATDATYFFRVPLRAFSC